MARVRWGNVGRLAALLAAALLILGGPRRSEPVAPARPAPVATQPAPVKPAPRPEARGEREPRGDDREERRGSRGRDSRVAARAAADAG